MITGTQLDEDLAEIVADAPGKITFTFNGGSYTGLWSEWTKRDTPEIGGFVRDYDANIGCRVAVFTGLTPTVGATLTAKGQSWRVVETVLALDDISEEPIWLDLRLNRAT